MVCAGRNAISLVSLEAGTMETLITTGSLPIFGQQGVIFPQSGYVADIPKSERPVYMVFASSMLLGDQDLLQYNIHRMAFQNDFQDCLRTIGHLPSMKVADMIQDKKKIQEQE